MQRTRRDLERNFHTSQAIFESKPIAWAKVLVEEGGGRIVGAHTVGHRSEELIHLFALAMRHNITPAQVKRSFFAFPTFSADVKSLM